MTESLSSDGRERRLVVVYTWVLGLCVCACMRACVCACVCVGCVLRNACVV